MYAAILPCNGWYFVCKGARGEKQVLPVAVWALTDKGEVVGMIAVNEPGKDLKQQLIVPAPLDGIYLTEGQLSESERTALARS